MTQDIVGWTRTPVEERPVVRVSLSSKRALRSREKRRRDLTLDRVHFYLYEYGRLPTYDEIVRARYGEESCEI